MAPKKPSSEVRKSMRSKARLTSAQRKELRRKTQDQRHQANVAALKRGEMTPWMQAESARSARRTAAKAAK